MRHRWTRGLQRALRSLDRTRRARGFRHVIRRISTARNASRATVSFSTAEIDAFGDFFGVVRLSQQVVRMPDVANYIASYPLRYEDGRFVLDLRSTHTRADGRASGEMS